MRIRCLFGGRESMTSNIWRADIQGLRAIAVLSVVLYHGDSGWLPGGFIGVDIFFVISGYLITQILLKNIDGNTFSVVGFYQRRIRRLFPALFLVLGTCIFFGALLLDPTDFKELAVTTTSTVFFVSNLAFYKYSDYFSGSTELKPLIHTWSLAVEEQFYILFPIFLTLSCKYFRKWLTPILLTILLSSFVLSGLISTISPRAGFYFPFARAHELLMGAVVAASPGVLKGVGPRVRSVFSLIGLALISAALLLVDKDRFAFPGWIAAVPCFGTALVIEAGRHGETLAGALIKSPPLQLFGNLSYSLYLWHWPILVFGRHLHLRSLTPAESASAIIAAIIIAYLSWRFVETPFIRGAHRLPVISLAGVGMASATAISALIFFSDGWSTRFPQSALQYANARSNFSALRKECHISGTSIYEYNSTCVIGSQTAEIAVWGDSHGAELSFALSEALTENKTSIRQITASGCPPALDYARRDRPNCIAQNHITLQGLISDDSIHSVILTADIDGYPARDRAFVLNGLKRSISKLRAAEKDVVIITQIPHQPYNPPTALSLLELRQRNVLDWGISRLEADRIYGHLVDEERKIALSTDAKLVYSIGILCNARLCPAIGDDNSVLYFNHSHLSISGARLLVPEILSIIPRRESAPSTDEIGAGQIKAIDTKQ